MIVRWNKEKLICAVSVVIFGLVVARSVSVIGETNIDPTNLTLSQPPQAPVTSVRGSADVAYYSMTLGSDPRNPFIEITSWRPAPPDPLVAPPAPSLTRRIPLPVPVARSSRALPTREDKPPVIREAEQ